MISTRYAYIFRNYPIDSMDGSENIQPLTSICMTIFLFVSN
jgi:hypothetical protein